MSRSRWGEYRELLVAARDGGYRLVSLEAFILEGASALREPLMILRHDVDQAPRSALRMLAIEQELGATSTWYFRWRTADAKVIAAVRAAGGDVGLHYETLTRAALSPPPGAAAPDPADPVALDAARQVLKSEIALFAERFGPTRSAAAHGDTRVPDVRNGILLRDQDPAAYGIAFDANEAMRRHELACWLTDRSAADGSWAEGRDAGELLRATATPILCLTHPNNWMGGPALWMARFEHRLRGDGDRPPF